MEYINRFIRQCKADGKSENTIGTYEFNLNQFFDEVGRDKIININRDIIEDWKLDKIDRGKSARTINLIIAALRSFYNYLIEQDKIESNPCKNIKNVKVPKRKPEFMTIGEVDTLLEMIRITRNANRDRNYLMMRIFLHCGLRISEVSNAKISDLNFTDYEMTVIGKGDKERQVPLDNVLRSSFADYMQFRDELELDSEYLFVSRQNKQLSTDAIRKELDYYKKMAQLNPKISPHKLRHTFATLMYENEVPLEVIQEWLGHSNIRTTQIYAHMTKNKKRKEAYKSPFIHI